MPKKIIYQHTFLIAEIMCGSCGYLVGEAIFEDAFQNTTLLPDDAHIMLDKQTSSPGLHRLLVTIESAHSEWSLNVDEITQTLEKTICETQSGDGKPFRVIHSDSDIKEIEKKRTNWLNLSINIALLVILIALSIALPPSLPLTLSLIIVSFLTTAFTSRHYFLEFWQHLRKKRWLTMSTGVSLGWTLSLAHALYHTISMPAMLSFSMLFMNVAMPVMLVTIVGVLDEIQHAVKTANARMQLEGMQSLFQFSDTYESCEDPLGEKNWQLRSKAALKKGMWVRLKPGECVPADSKIVEGQSLMNTAILNGKTKRLMRVGDEVFGGFVNLSAPITIEVQRLAYHSLPNQIIFGANRERKKQIKPPQSDRFFIYFYTLLIVMSLVLAIVIPYSLGALTLPLALQAIIGIVFAICPCTILIAHQLPRLLLQHRLRYQKILLRDEDFLDRVDDMHTIVFDKSGTLTSDHSKVVDTNVSSEVWGRVYLLEKYVGSGHPLAKAICDYKKLGDYEQIMAGSDLVDFNTIKWDEQNRGLEGAVQARHIQIGNYDYLNDSNVANLPSKENFPADIKQQLDLGHTPIFVAQDGYYVGSIFVKHEIEPPVLAALQALHKRKNIKLIMLTGDIKSAANQFNKQCGQVFNEENIYAHQASHKKEETMRREIIGNISEQEARGIWFVGDNTNDLLCATVLSEKGGVACAMNQGNQTAYFADVVLNGSLDYVLQWRNLNQRLKKNIVQNQALLAYAAVIFLTLLVCLPLAGVGMAPVIPLLLMVSTTFLTVFNAYRIRMVVDVTLDKRASWLKRFLASDISLALLVGGSLFFVVSLLIMTFVSGHLAMPALMFSAGIAVGMSSGFLLAAVVMFGGFASLLLGSAMCRYFISNKQVEETSPGKDVRAAAPIQPGNEPVVRRRSWQVISNSISSCIPSFSQSPGAPQSGITSNLSAR